MLKLLAIGYSVRKQVELGCQGPPPQGNYYKTSHTGKILIHQEIDAENGYLRTSRNDMCDLLKPRVTLYVIWALS